MHDEKHLTIETLAVVLMHFDSNGIEEYDETLCALTRMGSYSYALKKFDLDLKNKTTTPAKPSIKEPLVLELKLLSGHLRYVFWE